MKKYLRKNITLVNTFSFQGKKNKKNKNMFVFIFALQKLQKGKKYEKVSEKLFHHLLICLRLTQH